LTCNDHIHITYKWSVSNTGTYNPWCTKKFDSQQKYYRKKQKESSPKKQKESSPQQQTQHQAMEIDQIDPQEIEETRMDYEPTAMVEKQYSVQKPKEVIFTIISFNYY